MALMKLAIVVPAFNEEVLLGRCLEAIRREITRSGRNVETVVVRSPRALRVCGLSKNLGKVSSTPATEVS
jgi:hypothetical protein